MSAPPFEIVYVVIAPDEPGREMVLNRTVYVDQNNAQAVAELYNEDSDINQEHSTKRKAFPVGLVFEPLEI